MARCNYYVYQYITEDGQPYYVGKGSGSRVRAKHLYTVVPPEHRRIILRDGLTNKEAYDLESSLIAQYGCKKHGGLLDNKKITRWVAEPGWKHTVEAKKKISDGNTGKIRTAEQRKHYKGTTSTEVAKKIALTLTGRIRPVEVGQKVSQTLAHKLATDAVYFAKYWAEKNKQSVARKGKPWPAARRAAQNNKQLAKAIQLKDLANG